MFSFAKWPQNKLSCTCAEKKGKREAKQTIYRRTARAFVFAEVCVYFSSLTCASAVLSALFSNVYAPYSVIGVHLKDGLLLRALAHNHMERFRLCSQLVPLYELSGSSDRY